MVTVEELRLRRIPYTGPESVIYFLWVGDDLQYVGRTVALGRRLFVHWNAGRRFDAVSTIECPVEDSKQVEQDYIEKYRPPWNDCTKARKAKGLKGKNFGKKWSGVCRPHAGGRPVQTPKGIFPSVRAAAEVFGVTRQAIWQRASRQTKGWKFIGKARPSRQNELT
jgi:hypothetical protein